jgi:hypothetical protein
MTTTVDATHYEIDGERYPRVTAVLGVRAKPGLVAWRRRVGFVIADATRDRAAATGTQVHAACAELARGADGFPLPAVLTPSADAFLVWSRVYVRHFQHIEHTVHSHWYGFAGTLDYVITLDDGTAVVVDLKTSNAMDADHRLQTAAYSIALREMGGPKARRGVLQLPSRDPGTYSFTLYPEEDDADDCTAFLHALGLYTWAERRQDD